jgi:hypothetical protein
MQGTADMAILTSCEVLCCCAVFGSHRSRRVPAALGYTCACGGDTSRSARFRR